MKIKSRYVDTASGYVKLYIPGVGVIEEHRYIMQEYLGRKLCYNEVVHHKDRDGQNNALENLEVMDRSTHARLHATTGRPMVGLRCGCCGRTFARSLAGTVAKIKQGQKDFYCGRSCAALTFGRGRSK